MLKQCVVETVGRFPWSGLGHALQKVDCALRISNEKVKKVLCKEKSFNKTASESCSTKINL